MKKHFIFIRPGFQKHSKIFLFICLLLLLSAFPLYKFSESLSINLINDNNYLSGEQVSVDYNLDLEIYDNYFDDGSLDGEIMR